MIFKFPTTIYFGKEHYTEVLEFIVHKRVLIITSKSGRRLHDPIIASLLRDAASQNTLLIEHNNMITNELTSKMLKDSQFSWPRIEEEYFTRFFRSQGWDK